MSSLNSIKTDKIEFYILDNILSISGLFNYFRVMKTL